LNDLVKLPNFTLAATSAFDLEARLRAIDIAVPLVSEGRRKEHREQYMMARLLATMARTDRLSFPLQVVHSEKPDFILRMPTGQVGVECVEAVPTEHYEIEVLREKLYPDALNFGQRFQPGKENFTRAEWQAIAKGDLAGPPWMPSAAKKNWIAAIMQWVIAGKTAKLRKGNYSMNSTTWLLVQDEWPNPLHFYPERVRDAGEELLEVLTPLLTPPAFQAVFIASGDKLLCFQNDCLDVKDVRDLWSD
jgi:hypothetical protein